MIGCLPVTLDINGKTIPINSDFRRGLIVMEAFGDPNLSDNAKVYVMLDAIIGLEKLENSDYEEAVKQCMWFLDCGREPEENPIHRKKMMDWKQDEQMIFSAINDVAHVEVRSLPYMHWWTFIGYFHEIKDGLFSQVILIRQKKSKGKKLDKTEQEFYLMNKDLVDLKVKLSTEEQSEKDSIEKWLESYD